MVAFSRNRFVFFFFLLLASKTAGQNKTIDLKKSIRLKPGIYRIDSLLQVTALQSGYVFSYSTQKLNVGEHISIKESKIEVAEILSLLNKKGVAFKVIENYIVINALKKSKKNVIPITTAIKAELKPVEVRTLLDSAKKVNRSTPNKSRAGYLEENNSNPVTANGDVIKIKPFVHKDSLGIKSVPVSPPPLHNTDSLRSRLSKNESIKKDSAESKENIEAQRTGLKENPQPKPKTKPNLFFLKSGLMVDESSFVGAMTQVGIPLIYASMSANTTFKISHLRYGVGSSIKLNNTLLLHFNFNTGNLAKLVNYSDSANNKFPIAIKSSLTRYSVAVEFSLKEKIKIQVGPVFNRLVTNYFINNIPSNLSIFNNGDHLFYTIYPPYLISNSYSPTATSNTKTWLGVQLNILYFLKFF